MSFSKRKHLPFIPKYEKVKSSAAPGVARQASASKETLYAWFGEKLGLFEAVMRRNAGRARVALNGHLDDDTPVEAALTEFGHALAAHLLCDNAVAINRAAISEARSGPSLADRV